MSTIKIGVREFRERIATYLESGSPVAVTRRGETLGVYVPTRRKRSKTADLSELKAAAERLAEALADVNEDELVAEFKQRRRNRRGAGRSDDRS
jgi:antitoxin (DNA-binding transcriptional repressor) of toxin-antitoxin stability system